MRPVAPKLLAAQKPLAAARREKVAAQVSHRPARGLSIVHARLFDPVTKKTTEDATITIVGDRVKSVSAKASPPAGYEVLDASGKTVLPGLWDMHVHSGETKKVCCRSPRAPTVRTSGARWSRRSRGAPAGTKAKTSVPASCSPG